MIAVKKNKKKNFNFQTTLQQQTWLRTITSLEYFIGRNFKRMQVSHLKSVGSRPVSLIMHQCPSIQKLPLRNEWLKILIHVTYLLLAFASFISAQCSIRTTLKLGLPQPGCVLRVHFKLRFYVEHASFSFEYFLNRFPIIVVQEKLTLFKKA